jgi:hypothetical protein
MCNYYAETDSIVQQAANALDKELSVCMTDAYSSTPHFERAEMIAALASALDAAVKAEKWLEERNT